MFIDLYLHWKFTILFEFSITNCIYYYIKWRISRTFCLKVSRLNKFYHYLVEFVRLLEMEMEIYS